MRTVFESENIIFTEVSEDLINDYLLMVNDMENVNRFIGGSRTSYTEEDEVRWVRKKLEENTTVYSMIGKSDGEFIGNIEFMDISDGAGELGIAITAGKQDMGYGTEAVSAMVRYGREQLGLNRIWLRTRPFNTRAIHVYEKCGFSEYDRDGDHIFMEQKER